MSHLLFWPTKIYFYPIGNTSAVCLTENLAPESKADILLLACGDPRHILYTIYANEINPLTCTRMFDITCCDVDVAILARNALLLTILADGTFDELDNLWNLFYHILVDRASLSLLFKQCHKLVALAESSETWRAGPYSHFLTTCDAATLAGLRRVWTMYLDTNAFSSKKVKQFEQRFMDGMKEALKIGYGCITTAGRSAGPLALHADQAVLRQFRDYWTSGTTEDNAQGQSQGRHLKFNPTFTFSIDVDKFSVHYATDPLGGFHLGEAFTSGSFTRPNETVPPHKLVRVARDQFTLWCTSISKRLKNSNPSSPTFVIRMFAGDALMFSQALKYCDVMRSPATPYNVAAWQLSTITLDEHHYRPNAVFQAPLSFNVIDTSNILDHLGLINLLVVTTPLLCRSPCATLYTESLHSKGDNPSQAILEHLCEDLPTMALLLGIIPSTFMSLFTSRSNVYKDIIEGRGASQYHERLAWKLVGFEGRKAHGLDDVTAHSQRLFISPEDLAKFLLRIYIKMFSNEDMKFRLQQLSVLSPERKFEMLQTSGILHYNRRSFALMVHFVKTRIQTDWLRAMNLFQDLVMSDSRLLMGQHAYQELCCQLHLLGVYTTEWMSIPALHNLRLEYRASMGPFHDWTQSRIPQVVNIVLVVPREAITKLERDFMDVGTPVFHCDMGDGPRQNLFAVTSATFGSLRVSGTGENRIGVIMEGNGGTGKCADVDATMPAMQPPWKTGAPLITMFSVPSAALMDFGRNPMATVALALRATPGVAAKFMNQLGFHLTIFRTKLTDAERVFVLAQPPVVGTSASTSTGRGAVTASHWHENMRKDPHSEQTAASGSSDAFRGTNGDVHVQMNDKSSVVQSFTIRVNVTDLKARTTLADTKIVPTVESRSGSTRSLDAFLRIGSHTSSLRFPLPVNITRAKLRVARKSSYVEVIAPLGPFDARSESDISNRFARLVFDPNDVYNPTLGSIHRINLDGCPMFKLPKGSLDSNWCDLHIKTMFSEREEQRAPLDRTEQRVTDNNNSTPDTFLNVKRTLHLILRSAARATPEGKLPGKLFALHNTFHDEAYLYIIVARMCLDSESHTVVADAFVAPSAPEVRAALDVAIGRDKSPGQPGGAIQRINTDVNETAAWFYLLPHLTERCRTWPHKTGCEYRSSKHQNENVDEHPLGTWEHQSPLCTCGAGMGTEVFPKRFEQVAPYLTRAAFSPLFPVPFLEVNAPTNSPTMATGQDELWEAAMRRATLDQNADVAKTDAAGVGSRCQLCGKESGLACSRCKRARYCSKVCQHADWKSHKKDCKP